MTVLPTCLRGVFGDIPAASTEIAFEALVHRIENAVRPWPDSVPLEDQPKVRQELFALGLYSRGIAHRSKWNLLFGPSVSVDGRDFPDLADLSPAHIEYWIARSAEAGAPVLVARYADAAWEFREAARAPRLSVDVVRRAIDARLACAGGLDHLAVRVEHAERALHLAVSIGDDERAARAASVALDIAEPLLEAAPALVNRVLLLLLDYRSKARVDWTRADRLAEAHARSIDRFTGPVPPIPNGVQILADAEVLHRYVLARTGSEAAKDLVRRCGSGVLAVADRVPPNIAADWLQDAVNLSRSAGLGEQTRTLIVRLEAANCASAAAMQQFGTTIEITADEKTSMVRELLEGGVSPALSRFARSFTPVREKMKQDLVEAARESPLVHLIQTRIMDGRHVRARVGGLLDDEEGQLLLRLSEQMKFASPFVAICLEALIREFGISGRRFVGILGNSPAFDESHAAVCCIGFEHYLRQDFISALSVLVPQVEHLLRGILRTSGETASTARADETYRERILDGLLKDATVIRVLGADATWYLQGLLVDPRCWNVRHEVAHGLLADREFSRPACERVIHALLLIVLKTLPSRPAERPADSPPPTSAS